MFASAGDRTPVAHAVVRHYTDRATPAPNEDVLTRTQTKGVTLLRQPRKRRKFMIRCQPHALPGVHLAEHRAAL
jgi:hypothetical protein